MANETYTLPVTSEARRMVNASMRQSGLTSRYRALVEADPVFGQAAARAAWYLSLKIKHPHIKKPLLHQCLGDAVLACNPAQARRATSAELDRFVETLANRLTLLLRYSITRAGRAWDPLLDPPLMEWFKGGPYEIEANTAEVSRMVNIAGYVATMRQRLAGIHMADVVQLKEPG